MGSTVLKLVGPQRIPFDSVTLRNVKKVLNKQAHLDKLVEPAFSLNCIFIKLV